MKMFQTFENTSAILKLRLSVLTIVNVLIIATYCQAGQKIFNESGRVFDTLTQCSWYNWDARNKQILLIFMANSLKPSTLVFAGIVVDYKLAVSVSNKTFQNKIRR
jgi:hypothetical protein